MKLNHFIESFSLLQKKFFFWKITEYDIFCQVFIRIKRRLIFIMKYFLLLFFLTLVLMQRGGGRGGGGGKGGRSSGGIGLFPAVTETSFMRGCSSDCRLKFGFNPSQLAMCLDSCHSQDRWRTFKIIGSIIGCLCCFTCCLQVYF